MLLYKLNNEFEFGDLEHDEINRLDDEYHLVSNRYVEQTIQELEIEIANFLFKQEDSSLSLIILKNKTPYNKV